MKPHPIQLLNVQVEELNIIVHDRVSFLNTDYPKTFDYSVSRTNFDDQNNLIAVKVDLEIKPEDEGIIDRPFSLKVSVSAQFSVDVTKFPIDKIYIWAENNAPIVILPYVREHVYMLTMRSGFDPVILPLVEVPTIKVVQPEQDKRD